MRNDRRHRAREAALQILYQAEISKTDVTQAAGTLFDLQWPGTKPPSDDVRGFATELALDTVRRRSEIDPLIRATAERWRPERMLVLDHLILSIGVCELLRADGTPAAVIINEALELARRYSTEESVKFINGMLDAIRKKVRSL